MLGFKSLKGLHAASFDEEGFCDNGFLNCGGGKGGSSAATPVFAPPPAAPAVTEAATITDADTAAEEEKRKQDAIKSGTKSLQIPITSDAGAGTIGTGKAKSTTP